MLFVVVGDILKDLTMRKGCVNVLRTEKKKSFVKLVRFAGINV